MEKKIKLTKRQKEFLRKKLKYSPHEIDLVDMGYMEGAKEAIFRINTALEIFGFKIDYI